MLFTAAVFADVMPVSGALGHIDCWYGEGVGSKMTPKARLTVIAQVVSGIDRLASLDC